MVRERLRRQKGLQLASACTRSRFVDTDTDADADAGEGVGEGAGHCKHLSINNGHSLETRAPQSSPESRTAQLFNCSTVVPGVTVTSRFVAPSFKKMVNGILPHCPQHGPAHNGHRLAAWQRGSGAQRQEGREGPGARGALPASAGPRREGV